MTGFTDSHIRHELWKAGFDGIVHFDCRVTHSPDDGVSVSGWLTRDVALSVVERHVLGDIAASAVERFYEGGGRVKIDADGQVGADPKFFVDRMIKNTPPPVAALCGRIREDYRAYLSELHAPGADRDAVEFEAPYAASELHTATVGHALLDTVRMQLDADELAVAKDWFYGGRGFSIDTAGGEILVEAGANDHALEAVCNLAGRDLEKLCDRLYRDAVEIHEATRGTSDGLFGHEGDGWDEGRNAVVSVADEFVSGDKFVRVTVLSDEHGAYDPYGWGWADEEVCPSLPSGVVTITGQHHEKLDGTGYPNGLKGAEINELGRMAAITDVFGALTDRRCYKDPMPPHDAVKLMREGMVGHLDTHMLGLFTDVLLAGAA